MKHGHFLQLPWPDLPLDFPPASSWMGHDGHPLGRKLMVSSSLPSEGRVTHVTHVSLDWLKGKFTGNHRFSIEIWDFPVIFPLNQPLECSTGGFHV